MIKIYSHHRKPVDTQFHKNCRDVIRKEFYYYMPKGEAKGYVNNAHTFSARINTDINDKYRNVFCSFLKSIGEEVTDKSLYLLSLLQKVGEDKIYESIGYNNSIAKELKTMTLQQLETTNGSAYSNNASESMFKESLGLSIFVAQALIFAFNSFKSIWFKVKDV